MENELIDFNKKEKLVKQFQKSLREVEIVRWMCLLFSFIMLFASFVDYRYYDIFERKDFLIFAILDFMLYFVFDVIFRITKMFGSALGLDEKFE